jgi:hypothetical protein
VQQWSWNKKTERIIKSHCRGFTLNICCGNSQIGDVRVDLNRSTKPTLIADVKNLPFQKNTFDTVVCDPPFSLYSSFKWIPKLADLCRQKLMLSTPTLCIRLSKKYWRKKYLITEQNTLFLRIWQIFEKTTLDQVLHNASQEE